MKKVSVRTGTGWRAAWLVSESGGMGLVKFSDGSTDRVPMTAVHRDGWGPVRLPTMREES